MACMEHWCPKCDFITFNNSGGPFECPNCGAKLHHDFDEKYDHYPERDFEEFYEREDDEDYCGDTEE